MINRPEINPYDPEAMTLAVFNDLSSGLTRKVRSPYLTHKIFTEYGLPWLHIELAHLPPVTILTEDVNEQVAQSLQRGDLLELELSRRLMIPPAPPGPGAVVASIQARGLYLYESPGLKLFRRMRNQHSDIS